MTQRNFNDVDISHTPIPEDAEIRLNFDDMFELKNTVDRRTAELKGISREFGNTLDLKQRAALNSSIRQNGFASQRLQRSLPGARKRDKAPQRNPHPGEAPPQTITPVLSSEELDSCAFAVSMCHLLMEVEPELYGEIKATLCGRSPTDKMVDNYQEDEKDLKALVASIAWVRGRG